MGLLQHASNTSGATVPSLAVTFGSQTTNGTALVVTCGSDHAISTVTLNGAADNWAAAASIFSGRGVSGWYDLNNAGSQTVIDINFGTNSACAADAFEWSQVATSGALDKTHTGDGTSNTYSSGATGTLSQASEVVFAAVSTTNTTASQPSGWTNETIITGGSNSLQSSYQQVSATTSLTYTGSLTSTPTWFALIFTLELSSTINVNLPLITTTNNTPPLTQPPIAVNLPLITTVDAVPAVTPTVGPPELVLSMVPIGVNDPLLSIFCPEGYTNFNPTSPQIQVTLGNSQVSFNNNIGVALSSIIYGGSTGELILTSGGESGADTQAELALESAARGGGVTIVDVVASELQVNGVTMTVP